MNQTEAKNQALYRTVDLVNRNTPSSYWALYLSYFYLSYFCYDSIINIIDNIE